MPPLALRRVAVLAVFLLHGQPALAQDGTAADAGPDATIPAQIPAEPEAPCPPAEPTPQPELERFVLPETGFVFALEPEEATPAQPAVDCPPPGPPPPVRPPPPDIFGQAAVPVGAKAQSAKWAAVREASLAGREGPWSGLLATADDLTHGFPLDFVNRWVNRNVRYREETVDDWTAGPDTLLRGYGDCEDFALAKMALLRELGVDPDKMFLVLVRDHARKQDHAVLAVRWASALYVLDSRDDRLRLSGGVTDYEPRMAYSGAFAWTYGYFDFREPRPARAMPRRRDLWRPAVPIANGQLRP